LELFDGNINSVTNESEICYYNNEGEFNRNFKGYLENPIPVIDALEHLELRPTQITVEDVEPRIFVIEAHLDTSGGNAR
jgi:hypothetical protein